MNTELARTVLADIKAHEENFNMGVFLTVSFLKEAENQEMPACARACYATFTALRTAPIGTLFENGGIMHLPEGGMLPVHYYAMKALEISEDQLLIFYEPLTIGELEASVDYLARHPNAGRDDLHDAIRAVREPS